MGSPEPDRDCPVLVNYKGALQLQRCDVRGVIFPNFGGTDAIKNRLPCVSFTIVCLEQAIGATLTCNSCSDCSTKLQAAAAGDTVELTTDISSTSGNACVDFSSNYGILFDGGGHVVARGAAGYHGIYSESAAGAGNTDRNVEVRERLAGAFFYEIEGGNINGNRIAGNEDADIRGNLFIGMSHAVAVFGDSGDDID
jgi:hypothetical protein